MPRRSGSFGRTSFSSTAKPGDGQEEPLALADEGGVLAAVAGLGPQPLAGLGGQDLGGLEGLLGLADGADRGGLGDAGDEPVPLVVAAQELALLLALPDQEQQVAVGGLHVEDGDLGPGLGPDGDLEELAPAVGLHVQGDDPGRAGRGAAAGRRPSGVPRSGRTYGEEGASHERGDTASAKRVRLQRP